LKWTAKKLCTVRAARKIRPGLLSYSLGRLVTFKYYLNRHAGGEDATAILFLDYLNGIPIEMDKMIKKTASDQRLPPNFT
jgi:DNA polymerase-3 subunit epsilon